MIATTNPSETLTREQPWFDVQDELSELDKALILTATPVETLATLGAMSPWPRFGCLVHTCHEAHTYTIGVLGSYLAVHVQSNSTGGTTPRAAGDAMRAALELWNPRIAIMAGIAFGRDATKQSLGDVLVSKSLILYDSATIRDGNYLPRANALECNELLGNRFSQHRPSQLAADETPPRIIACDLLSGEKLVDDAAFKATLFKAHPMAQGGEMEGLGFATECMRAGVPWIVVKAISDWGEGKHDGHQARAAHNAIAHCQAVLTSRSAFSELRLHPVDLEAGKSPESLTMVDIAKRVYPAFEVSRQALVCQKSDSIHYEYATALDGRWEHGFLLVGANVNIRATISHFLAHNSLPERLTVCSPRVTRRPKGKDSFRVDNIKSELTAQLAGIADAPEPADIRCEYIDDYVWQSCLAEAVNNVAWLVQTPKPYIDQELHRIIDGGTEELLASSCDTWFQQLLQSGPDKHTHPVTVVLGRGGVGKTRLCAKIAAHVNQLARTRAVLISASDIVGLSFPSAIDSVKALYRFHAAHLGGGTVIDPDIFELSVSCGNIVLLIDGLDEIASRLRDQFDVRAFMESVFALNERFQSCRIIVTSRDYDRQDYLTFSEVNVVCLRGFDESHVGRYLDARLNGAGEYIKKARRYVERFGLKEEAYYNPLSLALICDIVERETADENAVALQAPSEYLLQDAHRPLDDIVGKLFKREIEKQSLDIEIDELFMLVSELCVRHRGELSLALFDETVRCYFGANESSLPAERLRAFRVNPLLSIDGARIRIAYGMLLQFFAARAFRYDFLRSAPLATAGILDALDGFYKGDGDLFEEAVAVLRGEPSLRDVAVHYISELGRFRRELSREPESRHRTIRRAKIHRAVSGLLHLYFKCCDIQDRTRATEHLLHLYGDPPDKRISQLFIHGPFYALDFSELTVTESGFHDYDNLFHSRMPKEPRIVFLYCVFDFKQVEQRSEMERHHFDLPSCTFLSGREELFKKVEGDLGRNFEELVKDVTKVLFAFRMGPSFVPRTRHFIEQKVRLASPTRLKHCLQQLQQQGLLEVDGASLRVSHGHVDSCNTLVEQRYPDNAMEKSLKAVLSRMPT